MHILVYLPLLVPLVAAGTATRFAESLEPRLATWLLTSSAVLLALVGAIALADLAATAIGQIHLVAAVGDWSARVLRHDDPASRWTALAACVLLGTGLVRLTKVVLDLVRALTDAARTARHLPAHRGLSVLDDPAPNAFALPGRPGRIVVSTGLLRALTADERRVLLAHERAHLDCRHHLFVIAAQCAAAMNPLLRPVATAVAYTVERWADERAAQAPGDRELVARTIGKAALLTAGRGREHAMALAVAADATALGPVPRRVAALLATPIRTRRLLLAVAVVVLATATFAALEACQDLDALFDLARAARP